jgi:PilZ domain
MWQAPNQRVRASANAKKRERERSRRPLHIKRIHAELELVTSDSGHPFKTEVRVILNDLSPRGVGIFSHESLVAGQEVTLDIKDPYKIHLRARVIWCQEYDAYSHVLSSNPYSYRLGLEFVLPTGEEQTAIKTFCEEVSKNHLFSLKAV